MDKKELRASNCRYRYAIAPYGSSNREMLWVSIPNNASYDGSEWCWHRVCAFGVHARGVGLIVGARLVDLQNELLT